MRNTVQGFMAGGLMKNILVEMIQNRLDEYAIDPACRYAAANISMGNFIVAATKDALAITVVPKDDVITAYTAAMGVVARACKTGFTQSELERANAELLNSYEKAFNEKDKTYNSTYGRELISHFTDNEPTPGIAAKLELAKQILPMLPVEQYNMIAAQLLTAENQVIVVNQPLNDKTTAATEAEMVNALESAINAQYEAYVDEVITEPLIAQLPKAGSIKSTKNNALMGTTEFVLSNGVKVILKTTDFKADEIRVTAFRKGGKQAYSKDQAANVLMMNDAVELSKLGNFDVNTLKKYMAGKTVSLGYAVNNYTDVLEGSSSVKDFKTLAEVIYAYFTELNPDEATYKSQIEKIIPIFEARAELPEMIFNRKLTNTIYGNNPLMGVVDAEVLKKADYNTMLSMAKASLANAADYTFIFVGNVDEATLRPILEQYIATLPSKGKASDYKVVTSLDPVQGIVTEKYDQPMQSPVTQVYSLYTGHNLKWNIKNNIMIDLMSDVLNMVYVETIREDEGGTYGAHVGGSFNFANDLWQYFYFYQTAEDKLDRVEGRAKKELDDLLKNGAKADHFNKVKEAAIKQYEINSKTNGYWTGAIMSTERGANTYEGYIETLQSLTLDEFNKFLKSFDNGKNHIEVIMVGKEAAK